MSRDIEILATNDDDFLSIEQLLCDNASKTTKKMALAVNDDLVLVLSMLSLRMFAIIAGAGIEEPAQRSCARSLACPHACIVG